MADFVEPRFKQPTTRSASAYRRACDEVDRRSGGWCEVSTPACKPGRHAAEHHHHVLGRGQGGEHVADNLMHLCNAAHHWAHNVDRKRAEDLGIIRRRGGDAA